MTRTSTMGRVRVTDRGWDEFKHRFLSLENVRITVGVHGDEPERVDGESNVLIAGVHEFGSVDIPARPFVRPTFDANREKYAKQLRGVAVALLKRGIPLRQSIALVGMGVVRDIRQTIRKQGEPAGSFAPLSEMTLEKRRARRANNRTFRGKHLALIDTGQLINSIDWVARIGGSIAERGGRS
jgi:hypothetical protein